MLDFNSQSSNSSDSDTDAFPAERGLGTDETSWGLHRSAKFVRCEEVCRELLMDLQQDPPSNLNELTDVWFFL